MIGIFVALLSGALMSIQGVFNTEVTRQSSVWVSASWVQFWRCDRRIYHIYSDSGNVGTGTGKGNDADRDCPADDLLAH